MAMRRIVLASGIVASRRIEMASKKVGVASRRIVQSNLWLVCHDGSEA